MKIFCYSDIHFFCGTSIRYDREKVQRETCEWIASLIERKKPDVVINLGDVAHTHGYIDIKTLSNLIEGIGIIHQAVEKNNIPHIVLSGNHVQFDKAGTFSIVKALKPFKGLKPITDKPVLKEIKAKKFGFISYCRSKEDFLTKLRTLRGCDYLFVHQDINGLSYGKKDTSVGVDRKTFTRMKAKYIFTGHYHKPQELGNIIVVGSPCYYNFADNYTPGDIPRGAMMFLTGREKLIRYSNPHTPIFTKVTELHDKENLEKLSRDKNSTRLIVQFDCDSAKVADETKSKFKDCIFKTGKNKAELTDELKELRDFDYKALIKDFISKSDTTLDKEELISCGEEIIDKSVRNL